MREIKFRGRRELGNRKFIYGSALFVNGSVYITQQKYMDFDDIDLGGCFEEVDIKTVGQYTGLKDKKGKEIYEGDIIRYAGHRYEKGEYQIVFSTSSFIGFNNDIDELVFSYDYEKENILIIGNIHENPELLKDK